MARTQCSGFEERKGGCGEASGLQRRESGGCAIPTSSHG